jgi:concanavalin A-like lectin/glucanase superfamily protein
MAARPDPLPSMENQNRAAIGTTLLLGAAVALIAAAPWHGPILLSLSTTHGVDTGDLPALVLIALAIAVARSGSGRDKAVSGWVGAVPAIVLGSVLLFGGMAPTAGGGPLRPAGGGTFDGSIQRASSMSRLPVDRWSHVAVTYDGAKLRLYADGDELSSFATAGAIQRSANPLWIGGNRPYGEHFRGLIDDVRVYDRTLSADQVHADMSAPVRPAPGLVAGYAFDEGEGRIARDASGHRNVGEVRGAEWVRGRHGLALSFDGADAVVRVPPSRSLDLGHTMTLSAWVRPTRDQSGWRAIVQRQTDAYYLHASSAPQDREGLFDDLRAAAAFAAAAWFFVVIALGRGPKATARRRTWWAAALLFGLGSLADAAFAPSGTLAAATLIALWLAATAAGKRERALFALGAATCLVLTVLSLLDVGTVVAMLERDDGAVARTRVVGGLFLVAGLAPLAARASSRLGSERAAARPVAVNKRTGG